MNEFESRSWQHIFTTVISVQANAAHMATKEENCHNRNSDRRCPDSEDSVRQLGCLNENRRSTTKELGDRGGRKWPSHLVCVVHASRNLP